MFKHKKLALMLILIVLAFFAARMIAAAPENPYNQIVEDAQKKLEEAQMARQEGIDPTPNKDPKKQEELENAVKDAEANLERAKESVENWQEQMDKVQEMWDNILATGDDDSFTSGFWEGFGYGLFSDINPTQHNFYEKTFGLGQLAEDGSLWPEDWPAPGQWEKTICMAQVDPDESLAGDNVDDVILCNNENGLPLCVVAVHAEGQADYPGGRPEDSLVVEDNPVNYIITYGIHNPGWVEDGDNLFYEVHLGGYMKDGKRIRMGLVDNDGSPVYGKKVGKNEIETGYIVKQVPANMTFDTVTVMYFFSEESDYEDVDADEVHVKAHHGNIVGFTWGWAAKWEKGNVGGSGGGSGGG